MMQLPFYQSIDEVRRDARGCRACSRTEQRTQVVFGSGNPQSPLMLVGEYPSETDDRTGEPFTGPAGVLLDELLADVGIDRSDIWITNIVRCYATDSGERGGRLRPTRTSEVDACRIWMNLEIQWVDPKVIVTIGAPAARALIADDIRLLDERGDWRSLPDGRAALPTIQPAYALRVRSIDPGAFPILRAHLVSDLTAAAQRAGLIER
jgi:uracil-DNA glycosylase